jgi:hypothetical protein
LTRTTVLSRLSFGSAGSKSVPSSASTNQSFTLRGQHGFRATNLEAVEGDLSDFSHIVPHLRVRRENVEKYGLETLSLDAFVTVVAELADLTEDILRGDDKTIDSQIDDYL